MTPQVAGVLFIFLWLIVSQLATKLSYRRRLDKVIDQHDGNEDQHDDNEDQQL